MPNEVVLKNSMGCVKMHGFHGNPLEDSRQWGKAYKFNPISENPKNEVKS